MQDLTQAEPAFDLYFQPLYGGGRAMKFACDAAGKVDLDILTERARCNYFFALGAIGREFAWPAVQPGGPQ